MRRRAWEHLRGRGAAAEWEDAAGAAQVRRLAAARAAVATRAPLVLVDEDDR